MPRTPRSSEDRPTLQSAEEEFLFKAEDVPPMTRFLDEQVSGRPRLAGPHTSAWARTLYEMIHPIVADCQMSLLVAELSVLSDHYSPNPFFTTNIVSPADPPDGPKPVLSAYTSAIKTVARVGTTMNYAPFHALHYVHVRRRFRLRISSATSLTDLPTFRGRVPAHSLDEKAARRSEGNSARADIEKTCQSFFETFLRHLNATEQGENGHIHYLAMPFQRPKYAPELKEGQRHGLEPAGACFLILHSAAVPGPKRSSDSKSIQLIAARVQQICLISSLKASVQTSDYLTVRSQAVETTLKAYDGLGHAMRSFVEATQYESVISSLARFQADERVPPDIKAKLDKIKRSLAFFEHAEALGSLMRLHGWLADTDRGYEKVLQCFDRQQVSAFRGGLSNTSVLLRATSKLIKGLVLPLSYKDNVSFRIRYRDSGTGSIEHYEVSPQMTVSDEIEARSSFPLLRSDGDQKAILLALMVILLEPLRNASMHLRNRQPKPIVEVTLDPNDDGSVIVYIGNKWYGADSTHINTVVNESVGNSLVKQLMTDCLLGDFFPADCARAMACIDEPASYDSYIWVGLRIDPMRLYDAVSAKLAPKQEPAQKAARLDPAGPSI